MKTVTIPSNTKPNFVCEINGKVYQYEAGTTQSVPDEVASLIKSIENLQPKEQPVGEDGQVMTKIGNGEGWKDKFPNDGEIGDVLTKTEDGVEWAGPSGGSSITVYDEFKSEYNITKPTILKFACEFANDHDPATVKITDWTGSYSADVSPSEGVSVCQLWWDGSTRKVFGSVSSGYRTYYVVFSPGVSFEGDTISISLIEDGAETATMVSKIVEVS